MKNKKTETAAATYTGLIGGIRELLDAARRSSARAVNALMTATYWEIGHRIVEFEQGGKKRAGYGEELLKRLSADLTTQFGRGFSIDNLENMRRFYLVCTPSKISETLSRKFEAGSETILRSKKSESPSRILQSVTPDLAILANMFILPWSHYVLMLKRSRSPEAFAFYHAEALRGGWSVRQLQRQMDSQFYERTALSLDKAAMLRKGALSKPEDAVSADEEIREHWTQPGENPPVGVILCSSKGEALVHYATDTLPNKLLVREYLTALPDEKLLAAELERTRKAMEAGKE